MFIRYNSKVLSLKGYDDIGRPGEAVTLKCRLETSDLIGFDKSNEKINFYLDGKLIGSGLTDKKGFVTIEYVFTESKLYEITVKLDKDSNCIAMPGKIIAGIYSEKKPVVICDIDHTICDTKLLFFFFRKEKLIPIIKDSAKCLRDISKKYEIIYLTHRDAAFIKRTKYWLDLFNYPLGPIFFWDLGNQPFSNLKYKQKTILYLKSKIKNIVAGIGDKPGDVFAYYSNGLKGILFSNKKSKISEEIFQTQKWEEISDYLFGIQGTPV